MDTVQLTNGVTELKPLVIVTFNNLKGLLESGDAVDAVAFYELVQVCRNASHQIFSDVHKQRLINLSLLQQDGHPHGSIRNIVLASVEGEALDLRLVSPIQQQLAD